MVILICWYMNQSLTHFPSRPSSGVFETRAPSKGVFIVVSHVYDNTYEDDK